MGLARNLQKATASGVDPILAFDNPDLLAIYTMDNISGSTLVDDSPNSKDMIIAGPTGPNAVAGKIGNALDYGQNFTDRRVTRVGGIASSVNWSFSFWHTYPTAFADSYIYDQETSRFVIAAGIASDTNHYQILNASGAAFVASTATSTTTPFRHVVFTYDNSGPELKIYIDGAFNETITSDSFPALGLSDCSVGSRFEITGGSDWLSYNGLLDEYRIFNRVLIQNEVTSLFNEGTP